MDDRDEQIPSEAAGPAVRRVVRPARRLVREEKTIAAMIALYCRDHHEAGAPPDSSSHPPREATGDRGLCPECAEILDYARLRLDRCRYGAGKPTCANCTTHCYGPAMRERVRVIMRYSGPRMLKRHPVLAVAHLVDGRKTPGDDR